MKLTDLTIRNLPVPDSGQKMYWDGGFGVRVSQGGTKTFVAKHQGKWHTLGRYPTTSLKTARSAALAYKVGKAPPTTKKTLEGARSEYLAACEQKNRPATVSQYRLFLGKVQKPYLSDVKLNDVDTSSPHAVMTWRVFFNWCIRHEYVTRNPFQHQPVRWKHRDRVLTDHEIMLLYTYEYPPFSTYIKLLLLTGQRRGQFNQFTVDGDYIHFPASIMKNKRNHTIPLTDTTRHLIAELQPFQGWSKAKARLDRQISLPPWTLHDLRRTHSTIQAQLGTPIHVTESILSHVSGSVGGVAAVYNRYDYLKEAKEALDRLDKHIHALVT